MPKRLKVLAEETVLLTSFTRRGLRASILQEATSLQIKVPSNLLPSPPTTSSRKRTFPTLVVEPAVCKDPHASARPQSLGKHTAAKAETLSLRSTMAYGPKILHSPLSGANKCATRDRLTSGLEARSALTRLGSRGSRILINRRCST